MWGGRDGLPVPLPKLFTGSEEVDCPLAMQGETRAVFFPLIKRF